MAEPPQHGPAPMKGWHWIGRTVFGTDHGGHRYDVEVDLFDLGEKVWLYRDGELQGYRRNPATWTLEDGTRLQVRFQFWGLRHARLRLPDGQKQDLVPAPGTAEHWRARLDQERPRVGKALAAASFTVLLLGLLLALPVWISKVLGLFGRVWEPPMVSAEVAVVLTVLAGIAGLERALRLRSERFE